MISTLKRLSKEKRANECISDMFYLQPLRSDVLKWHFTIIVPGNENTTKFIYHGCLLIPESYPKKAPSIMLYTSEGDIEPVPNSLKEYVSDILQQWRSNNTLKQVIEKLAESLKEAGLVDIYELSNRDQESSDNKDAEFKCEYCGSIKKIIMKIMNSRERSKNVSIGN